MNTTREGFGKLVWVPDAKHGFKLCKLLDIGSETMTAEPVGGGTAVTARYDEVFPAEEDLKKDVDDNCEA
ncbi:unnamed protein product [Gongylonema pulchrum]|uniref:Myosin N-terminal SH3-like domain-containing protein n=1 Tax=Gongylonema pulchrum TaxID=637853 RepID=A0A183ER34_9BILA|nr:unnamed protein product [Gongylonema pulchrum]